MVKEYFVSDFETTSQKQYEIEGETRVYLHYTENIYNDNINHLGTTLEDYFLFLSKPVKEKTKRIIYFHNLTFDGQFIEYHFNKNGITYSDKIEIGKYKIIRSDCPKDIYQIILPINKNLVLEFRDSLKLLQMSVDRLPNLRGLKKLKYDYKKIRTEKTINDFSKEDLQYVKHDVWIVKDVLKELLTDIGDYLTIGSSSYAEWKKIFNKDNKYNYKNHFPQINKEVLTILRKAYNGGIVILNSKYRQKLINEPIDVYDVNSLYPSQMLSKMPYGDPIRLINKDLTNDLINIGYDFFIYSIYVEEMEIKDDYFPFVDITKNYTYGKKSDYPKQIKNSMLWLTNIDLDNIKKYYHIKYIINYELSFAFKTKEGIFNEYIEKFREMKENAPNDFIRMFAKYRLNTLYGKFGTNSDRVSCKTIYNNDFIEYELFDTTLKEDYYLPIAICITAKARNVLINSLQAERKAFIYCDTDSLHLLSNKYNNTLSIDSKKFGYWDFEGRFKYSYYYSNKQYIHYQNGLLIRTIAGLTRNNHKLVNMSNMSKNSIIKNGKKSSKHVKGGRIIIDSDFTFT